MSDYREYINALRKCAKEHEKDFTGTGCIRVSDLCNDTAGLLESLETEAIPIGWLENVRDSLDTLSESQLIRTIDLVINLVIGAYRVEKKREEE